MLLPNLSHGNDGAAILATLGTMIIMLPQLKIEGEDLLFAYNNRGMLSPGIETSWRRLAFVGEKLLDLAVVRHWFAKDPTLSVEELEVKRVTFLTEELLQKCIEEYKLDMGIPRLMESPPIGAQECRDFLAINVAKLFEKYGFETMQGWVSELIDPGSDHPPEHPSHAAPIVSMPMPTPRSLNGTHNGLPPESFGPAPPAPPYSPPRPLAPHDLAIDSFSFVSLSMFNAYATQKRNHQVTWDADHSGDPHHLTWTIKCLLDGEVKATASASSQKAAKELAAREVWRIMGWSVVAPGLSSPPLSPRSTSSAASSIPPGYSPAADLAWLTSSVFNEMVQKQRHRVEWTQVAVGQPHMPLWTVQCKIDGEVKGAQTANNTKEARLLAAREAWKNMGWGGMPPA